VKRQLHALPFGAALQEGSNELPRVQLARRSLHGSCARVLTRYRAPWMENSSLLGLGVGLRACLPPPWPCKQRERHVRVGMYVAHSAPSC
jgi:hypothetical protein